MKLLEELCAAIAPSGAEEAVQDVICSAMAALCDDITTDALGNLICHKRGKGETLLLETPVDSVGLAVTHVEENGRLRVSNIGDLTAAAAVNQRFSFPDGRMALAASDASAADEASLFLDSLGEGGFAVGDALALSAPFLCTKQRVTSPALSARVGAYCLITAAETAAPERDITFVFAAQGQLASRGARTAAFALSPSLALSVDAAAADEGGRLALGGGPAIKVMDQSIITDEALREKLFALSDPFPCQREISERHSDAGAIHTSCGGIVTGALAVPVRYYHTANETADIRDIEGTIRLLSAFIARA